MEFSPNFMTPDDEEAVRPEPVPYSSARSRRSIQSRSKGSWLRGFILSIFLVMVVIGSFWISFQLGRSMLSPLKEKKEHVAPIKNEANEKVPPQILKQADQIFKEELERLKTGKVSHPKPAVKQPAASKLDKIAQAQAAKPDTVPSVMPIEKVKPSLPKPAPAAYGNYIVQAGIFSVESNARNLASKLRQKGFSATVARYGDYWRVTVGSYVSRNTARDLVSRLIQNGYEAVVSKR